MRASLIELYKNVNEKFSERKEGIIHENLIFELNKIKLENC